jgi:hypothetical protein
MLHGTTVGNTYSCVFVKICWPTQAHPWNPELTQNPPLTQWVWVGWVRNSRLWCVYTDNVCLSYGKHSKYCLQSPIFFAYASTWHMWGGQDTEKHDSVVDRVLLEYAKTPWYWVWASSNACGGENHDQLPNTHHRVAENGFQKLYSWSICGQVKEMKCLTLECNYSFVLKLTSVC